MHALGLKFISGKYKGAAFAVPDGGELIIGRSGERDIVLEEEMVSRQHAKVRAEGEELILVDLGLDQRHLRQRRKGSSHRSQQR